MNLVLRHPGSESQTLIFALIVAQSAITVVAVTFGPWHGRPWLWYIVGVGALGITWAGAATVAAQLRRAPLDPQLPAGPHVEGYALVIGLALVLQGAFTFLEFLPFPGRSQSTRPAMPPARP